MERREGERRRIILDYNRRKYDRRSKTFSYERVPYLTDTNMFGNVYFAQYFDFQGEAREEFFRYVMREDYGLFAQQGYGMATIDAYLKFKKELFVYEAVIIKVRLKKLKRMKALLEFVFIRKDDSSLIADGYQQVAFISREGQPIPIPAIVAKHAEKFAVECVY